MSCFMSLTPCFCQQNTTTTRAQLLKGPMYLQTLDNLVKWKDASHWRDLNSQTIFQTIFQPYEPLIIIFSKRQCHIMPYYFQNNVQFQSCFKDKNFLFRFVLLLIFCVLLLIFFANAAVLSLLSEKSLRTLANFCLQHPVKIRRRKNTENILPIECPSFFFLQKKHPD